MSKLITKLFKKKHENQLNPKALQKILKKLKHDFNENTNTYIYV
jgi:hypothetical protein